MTTSEPADGVPAPRIVSRETVRTGRYVVAGANPADAARLWFVLHGYGQLAPRFIRSFEGIIPADTCVVAPEGLSRFYHATPQLDGSHLQKVGATWMTRESRETDIDDNVRWLDTVHAEVMAAGGRGAADAPPCAVLGFSQGVATAMRWVASGTVNPACFVAWAGGVASDVQHDLFAKKVAAGDLVLVAGDTDGFASPEARISVATAMRRYHPAPREILFSGSHNLDPGVLHMLLHEFASNG